MLIFQLNNSLQSFRANIDYNIEKYRIGVEEDISSLALPNNKTTAITYNGEGSINFILPYGADIEYKKSITLALYKLYLKENEGVEIEWNRHLDYGPIIKMRPRTNEEFVIDYIQYGTSSSDEKYEVTSDSDKGVKFQLLSPTN